MLSIGCETGEPHPIGYTFERSWGVRGESPGALREPVGILVVEDEIFVSDAGNNRIQVYSLDGDFLRAFGSEGDGLGELARPMHLGRSGQTSYRTRYCALPQH